MVNLLQRFRHYVAAAFVPNARTHHCPAQTRIPGLRVEREQIKCLDAARPSRVLDGRTKCSTDPLATKTCGDKYATEPRCEIFASQDPAREGQQFQQAVHQ